MIKFRQKEYSKRSMKIVRGLKKAINRADTAIMNASLKAQEKLGLSHATERMAGKLSGNKILTLPEGVKGRKGLISTKTNRQINREVISARNTARETGKRVLETPLNEGLNSGLSYASKNPLSAVGQLSPIPGTGLGAMAVEKRTKSVYPGYGKVMEKVGKKYDSSKFSRSLKNLKLPSIKDISQNLPIL